LPKSARSRDVEDRHVFLVGFSGSGKSTVGPRLARRLNCPFCDSDLEIAQRTGLSVAEFFAIRGEKAFRKVESEIVASLSSRRTGSIIALGGGALLSQKNRRLVSSAGRIVYLRCSMREIRRRLSLQTDRPLLHQRKESLQQRIRTLLLKRKPGYEAADIIVTTTTRTATQTTAEILRKLKEATWH
jgi:shikimate kinase